MLMLTISFLLLQVLCIRQASFDHALPPKLIDNINRSLNFMDKYYQQINMDGLLGLILAEAQLQETHQNRFVGMIERIETIKRKILLILPGNTLRDQLFEAVLLNSQFWITNKPMRLGLLRDLGIYTEWTEDTIFANREARWHGISMDVCFVEILAGDCRISDLCEGMVFGERNDSGYLLSHRLLYLQIGIRFGCFEDNAVVTWLVNKFCSLMLREARTNQHLGFPQHDIILEQIVLCGMEGFAEFASELWINEVSEWQTLEGCFKANATDEILPRTTNTIAFGCTDHTTGLGLAANALYLRWILQQSED